MKYFNKRINIPNSIYVLTIRAGDNGSLFFEKKDYVVYHRFLKEYLLPKDTILHGLTARNLPSETLFKRMYYLARLKNYFGHIQLLSYCLMPTYIKLILYQVEQNTISQFLQSVNVRYSLYFNKKYDRVGSLFREKAPMELIKGETGLLSASRILHRCPLQITNTLATYQWSSFPCYIGSKNHEWVTKELILKIFAESSSSYKFKNYQEFVQHEA